MLRPLETARGATERVAEPFLGFAACRVSTLMVTAAVTRSIFAIDKTLTVHRLATTMKQRLSRKFCGYVLVE